MIRQGDWVRYKDTKLRVVAKGFILSDPAYWLENPTGEPIAAFWNEVQPWEEASINDIDPEAG